ncbi:MAG: hypothetical protein MUD17_09950 [Gemmatimonadaceae bacterium]|nr:hypothetical protein [Gemmatimonadaceae bacterium]
MPRPFCRWRAALALLLAFTAPLGAQPAPTPRTDSTSRADALRVFLDCPGFQTGCALDFFVVDLPFANWTRDRLFADVQLLVTTLATGSGGTEWTVAFIGRERALSAVFLRGLYRYAQRTPLAPRFTLSYAKPAGEQATPATVRDPWNFWTFETSANAFLSGEQQQRFTTLASQRLPQHRSRPARWTGRGGQPVSVGRRYAPSVHGELRPRLQSLRLSAAHGLR